MQFILYNFILILTLPVAFAYFLWRIFVTRKSNQSWRDNLGYLPQLAIRPSNVPVIWIHAVSVGEVIASLPLRDELYRLLPNATILLTTITQTGNAVAHEFSKSSDVIAYFPLDYPLFVRRALERIAPNVVVTMEAEIWPNFLAIARASGIPVVLVNGRVSDRTLRRGMAWRWLFSWALSNFTAYCMQTQADAERLINLGASPEKVQITGNTKFDQEGGRLSEENIQSLRKSLRLFEDDPVFVAGSTNVGEEGLVIAAFREMRRSTSNLRLIIAPRQVERASEIVVMVESNGFVCVRRSDEDSQVFPYDVLVLDTFGELAQVYAVATITFVGGTLVPKGGHSLIQPIIQGKPVLFGPHVFKTRDIAFIALSAGVGFFVHDADSLATQAMELLSDPERLVSIDVACAKLVEENRGASTRSAELIARFVQSPLVDADVV